MHITSIRLQETLRPLRQQAGLTQAQLAEKLGVSDRAVSRWETGAALPDIALLPTLAMLLHVSVDALLGMDSLRRQAAIDAAHAACSGAMQRGDAPAAVSAARAALSAWPDEPEIMVALARALMALHTEAAAREALSLCRAADGKPARLTEMLAMAIRNSYGTSPKSHGTAQAMAVVFFLIVAAIALLQLRSTHDKEVQQ